MTQQSESALIGLMDKYIQRHGFKNDPKMYNSYAPLLYELAKEFVETYEANDLKDAEGKS